MKEQALIGARGLVSLGEVGLADEVGGMESGLRTVVGSGGTRLSGGSGPAVNSG